MPIEVSRENSPLPERASSTPGSQTETALAPAQIVPVPTVEDHQMICRIGGGSYGEVWLARNVVGTARAVKVVYRRTFDSDRPYEREFAGIQKFEPVSRSQEGLMDILQIGRNEAAGYFYYVMELADDATTDIPCFNSQVSNPAGYSPKTLRSEVKRRGRLPVAECLRVGMSLSAALDHLHRTGLVHRDVKPSNVILVNGVSKLADIGLVAGMSEARSFVGTEGFIPPEGPGSPPADLYSLGKLLYEISTGKDRQEFPQLPPELKDDADRLALAELNEIILKACANEAADRYQSAAEMREDLELLQRGGSIRGKASREKRFALGRRIAMPILLLACALGVLQLLPRFYRRGVPVAPATSGSPVSQLLPKVLAVLPFVNESPDPADAYLGGELAEDLGNTLGKLDNLRVLARNTAFALRKAADLQKTARELQVDAFLDASVRRNGNRLRLNAQLIDTAKGFPVWSEIYDGQMSEWFGIQDDVVQQVAKALNIPLPATALERVAKKSTQNFEAHHLYLLGRHHLSNGTERDLHLAMQDFLAAKAKDEGFALAYVGLADAQMIGADHGWLPCGEAYANAETNARKALEIDPRLVEAHVSLGLVRLFTWAWAEAEREFQQALALNSSYALARLRYAILLSSLGRFKESLEMAKTAEACDPLSIPIANILGVIYSDAGQHEAALGQLAKAEALDPTYVRTSYYRGFVYLNLNRPDAAVSEFRRTIALAGESPLRISALGFALARAGRNEEARQQLEKLRTLQTQSKSSINFDLAVVHLGLGERDQAFNLLEKALAKREPGLTYLKTDHCLFESVQNDPRFFSLLRRVGLEQ